MAMSLSHPHPVAPYEKTGIKLGDEQFAGCRPTGRPPAGSRWSASASSRAFPTSSPGTPPTTCSPGSTRSASATAATWSSTGYDFAPSFSVWTTIEECLNPPVIYERDRGWYTTEPLSEPEIFDFPGGIGPVECVHVEHEEVLLIPRWVDAGKVTFKYGLGKEFIDVLQDAAQARPGPHRSRSGSAPCTVSPRDVVAAVLPDPATLGDRMTGGTCAGTLVTGLGKDGAPRSVYLYHLVDNEWSMREYGAQAVVWQTAVNPVIALELLAAGAWQGALQDFEAAVSSGLVDHQRWQEPQDVAVGAAGQHQQPGGVAGLRPPRPGRVRLVVPGWTSSIASIAPRPRTSPMPGSAAAQGGQDGRIRASIAGPRRPGPARASSRWRPARPRRRPGCRRRCRRGRRRAPRPSARPGRPRRRSAARRPCPWRW